MWNVTPAQKSCWGWGMSQVSEGWNLRALSARFRNLDLTLEAMEGESLAGFQWGTTHRKDLNCLWCGGCSGEDALWWLRDDKGSICRDGMLGMDSRAIKEVELAGLSN